MAFYGRFQQFFNYIVSFIFIGGKQSTDIPQFTDKLYHIKLYQVCFNIRDN